MPNSEGKADNLTAPKFEAGKSGNPGGKTSEQRKAEIANAEKATKIRGRLLDAVVEATEGGASVDMIEASILKLVKDAEDRGLGTAVQSVNVESPLGTMSPNRSLTKEEAAKELERLGLPIPNNTAADSGD